MSVDKVAAGAAIAPAYLEYLESNPNPDPTKATVIRLAIALQTSGAVLQGGDQMVPPGQSHDQPTVELVELDEETCRQRIAPGGVGRCVFVDARGPMALPVNFGVLDGDIVFRTERKSSLASDVPGQRISFEVDHIDDAFSEGWSVLVTGTARQVEAAAELESVQGLDVQPWASGDRETYFRLAPEIVTGKQIVRGAA